MRRSKACRYADLLLTDYLRGALSGRQVRFLEAHLAACDRCRGDLIFLRGLIPALTAWRDEPSPRGLERRIMAAVSATGAPALRDAAILGALSVATLVTMPFILRFPAVLAIWACASAVAAFVAVWAAGHPNAEVKPWGIAAMPDGLF